MSRPESDADDEPTPEFNATQPSVFDLQVSSRSYDPVTSNSSFLQFDPDSVPYDDTDHVTDLNWCVDALQAVANYPHATLWIRLCSIDLFFTHHYDEASERAGYLRVGKFSRDERTGVTISPDDACESGVVNLFTATNLVYEWLVGRSHTDEYSLLLTTIMPLLGTPPSDKVHPMFTDFLPGVLSWSIEQLHNGALPGSLHRDNTAFPEYAYHDTEYDDSGEHFGSELNAHVNHFSRE
jgi:hypothetical protein